MTVLGDRFVKRRPDAPAGFFEVEAAGLRWLAVPGGVPVAEPLDVSPDHLTTVKLDLRPPTGAAADEFGRRLAVTHDAGARHYGVPPDGWDGDGYIGTIGLPHAVEPLKSWGEFYANLRLRPYLRTAYNQGTIDGHQLQVFERVCTRLEAGAYDDPSDEPSRIHGDLWSGNVRLGDGRRTPDRPGRARRSPGDGPRHARPLRPTAARAGARARTTRHTRSRTAGATGSGCTACTHC